ncbi:ribonuclease H-like domain-containing protein [Mycena filopes]|nr:ribonuclease H-like domain-containing protein [Mycena filopes]
MVENPLGAWFHRGELQNKKMYLTYCKPCVAEQLKTAGATATTLTQDTEAFKDGEPILAVILLPNSQVKLVLWLVLPGVKKMPGLHIYLAARSHAANASAEATEEATRQRNGSQKRARTESTAAEVPEQPPKKKHTQSTLSALVFRRNDMPYSAEEKTALQVQALRAIVSSGAPFTLFSDPEMEVLFGMMRTTAPDAIPSAKVLSGTLLDGAAEEVDEKIKQVMKNRFLGLSTDGWKGIDRMSVNGLCSNVDYKAYLLELVDVTDEKKDGPSQCQHFAEMIDRVEFKYGCFVIYFTTDADGGSKKGRILLGKQRPWLILPSCWAHQFQLILGDYFKVNDAAAFIAEDATGLIAWLNNHSRVRMIFNAAQRTICENAGVAIIVLAYLVANLTRWTTHFVAFMRLFILRDALESAVLQNRLAIIAAQVGAATSTEGARLKEEAEKYCALIRDPNFWGGLETILGDLEPICLGTNINQKDSTRPDQVLLTIAGIFLRFEEHPEPEVKAAMLKRLEKRWLDCDQPVFLLALILNPFEKISCFGPNANLNQLKCRNMLLLLYRRMNSRPDNPDTPEQKSEKEKQLTKAFMQYLAGTGDFSDLANWEEIEGNTDPVLAWGALVDSKHLEDLAKFAILLLKIVVNQAGVERTFSRTKIEQSAHRSRLGLDKIDKRTKIRANIRAGHEQQGLVKLRQRKNHKSTAELLAVPRYRDLLEDGENEEPSERGRLLVSGVSGWQTQMAKWTLGESNSDAESDKDDEDAPRLPKKPTWTPITLALLFGEAEKPRKRKPSARVLAQEARLMETLAEMEARADAAEDAVPDDGAIEIDSGEEYQ